MRVPAFLTAILTAMVGSAWAEAEPKAPVDVEPKYQSSFVDYRGFKDEPVKPWRESNEAMQGLGGHMGHLNNATESSEIKPTSRERPTDDKIPDGSKP